MLKGEFRISWFSTQPTIFLLLLIFMVPAHADVTVDSLTSDLPESIIEGDNPTYTLTVSNPANSQDVIDVTVSILDGALDSTSSFSSLSPECNIDPLTGAFSCDPLASGVTKDYQFTWITPPSVGDHDLTFDVGCEFDGVCLGETASIRTSVTAESVTVTTEIPNSAAPGGTVTGTISVVNNLSTDFSTTNNDSSVTPASLPAGGGSVDYLLTIPTTAIANEVITDTITITDSDSIVVTTIPVSVTVVADTVTVTDITLTAVPGGTATGTFTVSNALPTTSITTDPDVNSSVDPTILPAGGGTVEYSMTVPSTAVDNEVITDTITITDDANNVTTIAVSVTVSGDLFADLPGLTDSEREVAHALDEACAALSDTEVILPPDEIAAKTPVENLLEICNAMDSAAIEDQVDAIKQITPKQAPAQGTSSVEVSQRQFDNITARMKALRSGATGVSVAGLMLDYQGKALPINLLTSAARQSGGSAGDGSTALLGKLGFFLNGNLSFGEKDGSSNELGFDVDTRGITAGLDYRFTDQFIVGGSLGYVGSDTEFDSSRGDMDVKGYTLAVYSTYYSSESSYLDGIISYGWNDFDSSRKVSFLSFNEEASGDTDGKELSVSLGGGYDFNRNALSFGPFGRINYINADIDGYTENTSTGLELVYDDQEVESLTTLLGGQISYAISTSRGVFTPQLRLEWAHEFMDDSRFIEARFLHDPTQTSFRLATDDPDRDYFNLGAGVSATFGAGKSGYIYLETMLGQEDVKQHSLAAGFRLEF